MPTRGNAGKDQPVGAGKNRTCQQSGADGQGIMLESQMNSEIHRSEKIADRKTLPTVKAAGRIENQNFERGFAGWH